MLIVTLWSRSRRLSSSTSEKTLSAWVRSLTTTCMSALCCVDMTCLPSPASCIISEMSCVAGEWEWECMYWAAGLSCMAREAAAQSSAWVASPAPSGSASWSAPLEEIGGPPNPAKYKNGRSGQVRSGRAFCLRLRVLCLGLHGVRSQQTAASAAQPGLVAAHQNEAVTLT